MASFELFIPCPLLFFEKRDMSSFPLSHAGTDESRFGASEAHSFYFLLFVGSELLCYIMSPELGIDLGKSYFQLLRCKTSREPLVRGDTLHVQSGFITRGPEKVYIKVSNYLVSAQVELCIR